MFSYNNMGHAYMLSHVCDPLDCCPPGSSVHGISQARILEWVAIPFSRGSSQPRAGTHVSCIAGRFFTAVPPRKPCNNTVMNLIFLTSLQLVRWTVVIESKYWNCYYHHLDQMLTFWTNSLFYNHWTYNEIHSLKQSALPGCRNFSYRQCLNQVST